MCCLCSLQQVIKVTNHTLRWSVGNFRNWLNLLNCVYSFPALHLISRSVIKSGRVASDLFLQFSNQLFALGPFFSTAIWSYKNSLCRRIFLQLFRFSVYTSGCIIIFQSHFNRAWVTVRNVAAHSYTINNGRLFANSLQNCRYNSFWLNTFLFFDSV